MQIERWWSHIGLTQHYMYLASMMRLVVEKM